MKKREINSARTPIYRDSGFELPSAGITSAAFDAEKEHEREPDLYIYSRYRNPTVVAAEEAVMKVEGSEWALLAQSGMAAIDIAVSLFQDAGAKSRFLFFSEIYGGTISFINSVLTARRALHIDFFTPSGNNYDYALLEKTIDEIRPAFIYFETISNPLLIVADGKKIISLARKYGSKVVIDNTFATPILWRPLDDGADLVIHSATKYFSGHGNLTAGVLCGNDPALMQSAIEYRKYVGHMLSPDEAYRLQTQLVSFSLRFRKQCDNAAKLAGMLAGSEKISQVHYPGLTSHETHDTAMKMFGDKGCGAMVTFDFRGDTADEKRKLRDSFISRVYPEIRLVPTLGDAHTILMPVEPVWGAKYHEPGMIRISLGFEEWEHIEGVIKRTLQS